MRFCFWYKRARFRIWPLRKPVCMPKGGAFSALAKKRPAKSGKPRVRPRTGSRSHSLAVRRAAHGSARGERLSATASEQTAAVSLLDDASEQTATVSLLDDASEQTAVVSLLDDASEQTAAVSLLDDVPDRAVQVITQVEQQAAALPAASPPAAELPRLARAGRRPTGDYGGHQHQGSRVAAGLCRAARVDRPPVSPSFTPEVHLPLNTIEATGQAAPQPAGRGPSTIRRPAASATQPVAPAPAPAASRLPPGASPAREREPSFQEIIQRMQTLERRCQAQDQQLSKQDQQLSRQDQQLSQQEKEHAQLVDTAVKVCLLPDEKQKQFVRRVMLCTAAHLSAALALTAGLSAWLRHSTWLYDNPWSTAEVLAVCLMVVCTFYGGCHRYLPVVSVAMVGGSSLFASLLLVHADFTLFLTVCVAVDAFCLLLAAFCCQARIPYDTMLLLVVVCLGAGVGFFALVWEPYRGALAHLTLAWTDIPPTLIDHVLLVWISTLLCLYIVWQLQRLVQTHMLCETYAASVRLFFNIVEAGLLLGVGFGAALDRLQRLRTRIEGLYTAEREALEPILA